MKVPKQKPIVFIFPTLVSDMIARVGTERKEDGVAIKTL
jgi:hypothetical protein